jgi:hypothetical protein
MKRTRTIAAIAALVAVIGIPGTATAGGGNCVGPTAKVMHAAFRTLPGTVGEFLGGVREDPSGFPWCSE